jgi:tRNA A-37 threonylcarbamoyl transferase component Bud32
MPSLLRVIKGREKGRVVELDDGDVLVVGRAKDAELAFDDKLMSRRHARFMARDGAVVLTDLGSSNGCWVNGDRVTECRLAHGDRLKIGAHVFDFESAGATSSSALPYGPRPVVFCEVCYAAVPAPNAVQSPGGGWLCPSCVDGSRSLPPDIIDGYTLGEKLGQGRLGPVYRARHESLDKQVAIKIVHSDRMIDEIALRRFIREAKIGGRLFHPNIVEFYDAAECRGHYYISMEFVEGETLAERIQEQQQLPAREVAALGACIAGALAYAHRQGVIHRNLRPQSILLGYDGRIKLSDFGFARLKDPGEPPLTPPGEAVGTLCYMPPEQLEDASSVDARADIFGLGATLYHALVGAPPFVAATFQQMQENVRRGALVPLQQSRPDVPAELATTIAHCLAHERGHRYQTADELTQALQLAAAAKGG